MKNKLKKYADKYFLRSNEILQKDELNPWVNVQVFVRKGPGIIGGIDEAIELIEQNSDIVKNGGRIYAKAKNDNYAGNETVMNIVAPIQDIMELETVYLGVIAAQTTRLNDKKELDYRAIERQMQEVVSLAGDRPVMYFGARHWHYQEDEAIAKLAFENGVKATSTDAGAMQFNKKGVGTIPHALENIYEWAKGRGTGVVEATKAFDRHIDPSIERIALVDYNNKEITDTLATAEALQGRLGKVRVDTCGENIAEGGVLGNIAYETGKGVTVAGVVALRNAMNAHNLAKDVGIALTSGFSNPAKVKAFNKAEEQLGMKLYDAIGAGFLDGIRTATADIVAIGNTIDDVDFYQNPVAKKQLYHKVGRPPRPNYELQRRM